jgi:hypothetical protein
MGLDPATFGTQVHHSDHTARSYPFKLCLPLAKANTPQWQLKMFFPDFLGFVFPLEGLSLTGDLNLNVFKVQ